MDLLTLSIGRPEDQMHSLFRDLQLGICPGVRNCKFLTDFLGESWCDLKRLRIWAHLDMAYQWRASSICWIAFILQFLCFVEEEVVLYRWVDQTSFLIRLCEFGRRCFWLAFGLHLLGREHWRTEDWGLRGCSENGRKQGGRFCCRDQTPFWMANKIPQTVIWWLSILLSLKRYLGSKIDSSAFVNKKYLARDSWTRLWSP